MSVIIQSGTPYMIRNDGEIFECGKIHPYILYRQKFIGPTNLGRAIQETIEAVPFSFRWFFDHTRQKEVKDKTIISIQALADAYVTAEKDGFDAARYAGFHFEDFEPILRDFHIVPKVIDNDNYEMNFEIANKRLQELNNLTNQEFLRMRTGDKFFGNYYPGDVYFRVSSADFNWYNIIWDIIMRNPKLEKITIEYDVQSGKMDIPYFYQLDNGELINRMDRETFLTAKGNPIIENLYRPESKILQDGGTLIEAFGDFGPLHNINKYMSHKYSYMVRHFCKKDGSKIKYKEFKQMNFLEDQP